MKQYIEILSLAEQNKLPKTIDDSTNIPLHIFNELVEADYINAIKSQTLNPKELGFLDPKITSKGREYLHELKENSHLLNTANGGQVRKTSLGKIKTYNVSNWLRKLIVGFIITVVAGITILGIWKFINKETGESYQDSILHEINFARNMLDYTLLQRQKNIKASPIFTFGYRSYVPKSFSDNLPLKTKLDNLYRSLISAQRSAEKLLFLLQQNNSESLTINNLEDHIERVIKLADEVGPLVAKHIDSTWKIPPIGTSDKEKIQYYEREINILNSVGTAPLSLEP